MKHNSWAVEAIVKVTFNREELKEAIYQNFPLMLAGTCMVAGALIGRKVAKSKFGARMFFPALALIVAFLFFDRAFYSWFAGILTGLFNIYAAKLISIGLLSFVSGSLFTIILYAEERSKV